MTPVSGIFVESRRNRDHIVLAQVLESEVCATVGPTGAPHPVDFVLSYRFHSELSLPIRRRRDAPRSPVIVLMTVLVPVILDGPRTRWWETGNIHRNRAGVEVMKLSVKKYEAGPVRPSIKEDVANLIFLIFLRSKRRVQSALVGCIRVPIVVELLYGLTSVSDRRDSCAPSILNDGELFVLLCSSGSREEYRK